MAFQFSIWDRFKELGQISDANRQNLGKLLTHLFATKALSLSVFKVSTGFMPLQDTGFPSKITAKILVF